MFFRAGEIEAWGRGIERMYAACREAGSPAPKLTSEESGLWITFPYAPDVVRQTRAAATMGEQTPVETPAETPVETRVTTPDRILAALAANPELTLATLAAMLGKSLSAVERATAKLVKAGKLRFVGPRKGGHWEGLR